MPKHRLGSLDAIAAAAAADLPLGPETVAELFGWPEWIIKVLCFTGEGSPDRLDRLQLSKPYARHLRG